ncbi:NADP-dependent oxidoreductase [Nocardia sp. NPDC058705]|uniref:NADP-dependent oxidoreductase n=1 Tax=Nocardia sp. NPDC058705 TaxID=3346609 RepID=UPI003678A025
MVDRMRRAQLDEWGSPEVLHVVDDAAVPEAYPGHLLLETTSIGLNPVDWKTRAGSGVADQLPASRPLVLGWDIAGTVVATGHDSTGFEVGDTVFGMAGFPGLGNAYADYVAVRAIDVAHAPTDVDPAELAGTPMVSLTAWQALFAIAELVAGQRVLIHGGAGGVGHMAVQFAVNAGATVFATAGPSDQQFITELGASPIDYTKGDFADHIDKVDLVLDTIGGKVFTRSLDVIADGGRIVTTPDPSQLDIARRRGIRADWVFVHPDQAQLTEIAALQSAGKIHTRIDRRFTLAEIAEAHAYGEQGRAHGKIVVTPR